jgi:hypothetical protein
VARASGFSFGWSKPRCVATEFAVLPKLASARPKPTRPALKIKTKNIVTVGDNACEFIVLVAT